MNREDLDREIKAMEYEYHHCKLRFELLEKQYQSILSDKVIAENRLQDLILKRKRLFPE